MLARTAKSHRYLPPEWSPQSGTLLTWPHEQGDWGSALGNVETTFINLARKISRYQALVITCWDAVHADHVKTLLSRQGVNPDRLALHCVHSNDSWVRDHGPVTVYHDGRAELLDFRFNGWGDKFPSALDNQITRRLATAGAFGKTPVQRVDLVLEGGSIDTNGAGALLTTASCLQAPTRNPGWSREALEARLAYWFGTPRMHWLQHGALPGDDTDGHIDMLARFCDSNTIAYVSCDSRRDEYFAALGATAAELHELRDGRGRPYRLVPLPWPAPKYDENDRRLPLSYANFVIINHAVLVPTYGDAADDSALARLAGCFPERKIIGIHAMPLIRQSGGLHCVTMQLPRGVDIPGIHAGT